MKSGRGIYIKANGDEYNGDWLLDKYNGKGIFTWANGN